jgi:hypothetical protein
MNTVNRDSPQVYILQEKRVHVFEDAARVSVLPVKLVALISVPGRGFASPISAGCASSAPDYRPHLHLLLVFSHPKVFWNRIFQPLFGSRFHSTLTSPIYTL